ncbi:MAG: Ig-like domain-containing protein, partial [Candidatus Gracilibacteria bacterium]|nr:Ig-like domain-containing protein [Candidatus Gracilibacteria bacterium]
SDVETPDAGLTIVVDTPPAHTSGIGGSFVWNTNTQFTLTADGGYAGTDSFAYHVVDGSGASSATKTVTINNLSN